MALFVAIEVSHSEQASPHVPVLEKSNKELRSAHSMNYDVNIGSASCGRFKGRAARGEWRFSVLVNGSPPSFFSSSCGLKQGDLCQLFSLLL
jgi:hypothetical protein